MLGLDTLDIAIGLVFVYLMVSFVCSAAVELVEVFLKNRPRKLLEGIKELLQSDDLVQKVYKDPLVTALYKGKFGEVKETALPSYIPARNFALAVLNQLPVGGGNTNWERLNNSVEGFFTAAERTMLQTQRSATPPVVSPLLEQKEYIYKALKSSLLTAQGSVDTAIKGIEDWFNSSMDRVSGWFKRRTQYILLGFGAFCAVVYNVDTIYVVKRLTVDKALRAAVVASAGAAVNEGAPVKTPPPETIAAAKDRLTKALDHLNTQGLPIGWPSTEFDAKEVVPAVKEHALGWLLTAIAVSFGAPFWFDVLNKFMVVRSTMKPKEKSGIQKSKE